MTQKISMLTLSILASAAIIAERFVNIAGAPATAAATAVGVADSDGAVGALVPTTVAGTAIVSASAAIAKGAAIEVAAGGQAVTKATGVTVARALEAAAAAGDRIEVLLIPN